MKTRTDAAKILLDKGWTFEDIERVLEDVKPIVIREPYPVQPLQPFVPSPWPTTTPYISPPYRPLEFWCASDTGEVSC